MNRANNTSTSTPAPGSALWGLSSAVIKRTRLSEAEQSWKSTKIQPLILSFLVLTRPPQHHGRYQDLSKNHIFLSNINTSNEFSSLRHSLLLDLRIYPELSMSRIGKVSCRILKV